MGLAEAANLVINLSLRDHASRAIAGIKGQIAGLGSSAGKIGGIVSGGVGKAVQNIERLGVVVAGVGVKLGVDAVKDAMSFQAAMELIRTQAGATQTEVETMSKALLDLAPKVGTGPDALAAGLYHIESAGIRGAKALDVLTAAAEGARVGNADLESVSNALIASVTSGVGGITSMTGAMGTLNAIVGAGNMRMQDLADAFGTGILSTAKTFGISIQSVGAALADMTDQGIPAQDAATRLRMTISLLGAPTDKAAEALKSIGLKSDALAKAMRGPDGILGAVAMLKEHLDASGLSATEQATLLSHAFGGGRSSSAIMTLIGNVGKLQEKQDAVTKGAGGFGAAWEATEKTSQAAFDRFGASFDTLKIRFGTTILPVVTTLVDKLSGFLNDPATVKGIEAFGKDLSAGIAKVDWKSLAQSLKDAAGFAKGIISAFLGAPEWLRTAIITGWGLNKLTGGALTGIIGELGKGLIKGVLGMTAGMVNVKAASVTVVGGAGGVPGALPGPGNTTSTLGKVAGIVSKVFIVGMVAELAAEFAPKFDPASTTPLDQLSWPWGPRNTPQLTGTLADLLGPNFLGGDAGMAPKPGDAGFIGPIDLGPSTVAALQVPGPGYVEWMHAQVTALKPLEPISAGIKALGMSVKELLAKFDFNKNGLVGIREVLSQKLGISVDALNKLRQDTHGDNEALAAALGISNTDLQALINDSDQLVGAAGDSKRVSSLAAAMLGTNGAHLRRLISESGGWNATLARKLGISNEQLQKIKVEAQREKDAIDATKRAIQKKKFDPTIKVNIKSTFKVSAREVATAIRQYTMFSGVTVE